LKERPILFSGEMVRALLTGAKTQTRRVVKWPEWAKDTDQAAYFLSRNPAIAYFEEGSPKRQFRCPYGAAGDRLWVRETWGRVEPLAGTSGLVYRADGWEDPTGHYRWTPSIHMPRAASRINLNVTGVRIERLQDISEVDALAEGARQYIDKDPDYGYAGWYRALWESINGPESWSDNPWVWVIEFQRPKTLS
jgi:hypothetical protein